MHAQRPELAVDVLPAVDRHGVNGQKFRQMIDLLGGLHGELSRRREDDRLRRGTGQIDALENGNAESRRLPRAGLRLPDEILPGERGGDRRLLDRRGLLEAHIFDSLQNLRDHSQFFKRFVHVLLLCLIFYPRNAERKTRLPSGSPRLFGYSEIIITQAKPR